MGFHWRGRSRRRLWCASDRPCGIPQDSLAAGQPSPSRKRISRRARPYRLARNEVRINAQGPASRTGRKKLCGRLVSMRTAKAGVPSGGRARLRLLEDLDEPDPVSY